MVIKFDPGQCDVLAEEWVKAVEYGNEASRRRTAMSIAALPPQQLILAGAWVAANDGDAEKLANDVFDARVLGRGKT